MIVGEDSVETTLAAGWNELLLKVGQAGGGWVAAARVVTRDGAHDADVLTLDSPNALDVTLAEFAKRPVAERAAEAGYDLSLASGVDPARIGFLLRGVIAGTKDEGVSAAATKTLNDLEASEDHILVWELSGPYPGEGSTGMLEKAFAPEKDPATAKWEPFRMQAGASQPWIVDFKRILGGENRAAYMRTTVVSAADVDAQMEIGSVDGVRVWINGEVVHSNNAARPVQPCEDKFPVHLQKGENAVLMKVVQGGGDWAACARFRKPDGSHLDGVEEK